MYCKMPLKVEREIHDAIILMVDDEPTNIQVLHSALSLHGYKRCFSVNISSEAVEFCYRNPPDLVILDVMMPEMDGHTLCKLIKTMPGMANCPIIFSTNCITPADEIACWEAGGSDFVPKPVLAQTLVKRIESHVQLKLLSDVKDELILFDALTGLRNRGYYDVAYRQQVNLALRNEDDLSIIAIDVDYFKRYNDSYGHAAGDDCLRKIALVLEENVNRPTDAAVRYGGEEFVIILPSTDDNGARIVAQKILNAVKNLNLVHKESPFGVVTISSGIASLKTCEANMDLFVVADNKLYQAKELGRNQCA